jgi:hypothetical protein
MRDTLYLPTKVPDVGEVVSLIVWVGKNTCKYAACRSTLRKAA